MKQVTSIPGAPLFRSISALIIFFICFVVFLVYTDDISGKMDLIARDRVLKEINVALSMRLYQSTINGTLNHLSDVNKKNPFAVLEGDDYTVPKEYMGELGANEQPKAPGWYFDKDRKVIFYWDGEARANNAQLQFIYRDLNHSGRYEGNTDLIERIEMVSQ